MVVACLFQSYFAAPALYSSEALQHPGHSNILQQEYSNILQHQGYSNTLKGHSNTLQKEDGNTLHQGHRNTLQHEVDSNTLQHEGRLLSNGKPLILAHSDNGTFYNMERDSWETRL